MDSIQYGSIDICERIVEHFQLDVDECNTKTGEYPMTLAAEQNKIDIVSFLLKHTKNINIKGRNLDPQSSYRLFKGKCKVS